MIDTYFHGIVSPARRIVGLQAGLPLLLLFLTLGGGGACVESSAGLQPTAIPLDERAFVLLAGESEGQLYAVRIYPETKQAAAFGPAMPDVSVASHELLLMHVRPDRHRVVAVLSPTQEGGDLRVLAGDGEGWTALLAEPTLGGFDVRTSRDLSRVWTMTSRGAFETGFERRARVYTLGGEVIYDSGWQSAANAPSFVRFAPDGSWLLMVREETALLRLDDGTERVFQEPVAPEWARSGDAFLAFETSLLMRPEYSWVDLDGRRFEVDGFDAGQQVFWTGLTFKNGTLYELQDRRLVPRVRIGSLGSGFPVAASEDGRAVMKDNLRDMVYIVFDDDTPRAQFDAPEPVSPGSIQADDRVVDRVVDVIATRFAPDRTTVLVHTHFEERGGGQRFSFEEAVDAWVVQRDGTHHQTRLWRRRFGTPPEFQITRDGAHTVWWSEDEDARSADLLLEQVTSVDGGFRFSTQAINDGIPRGCCPHY